MSDSAKASGAARRSVRSLPRQTSRHLPRVALLVESSRVYGRGVLQGVAHYARLHGPWSFFMEERELHSGIPAWLRHWQGDGIIARVEDQRMASELAKLGCPVVDVLGQISLKGISGFDTDARLVAEMAVNFFLKAGFRHFGYCGYEGVPFSDRRGLVFQGLLEKNGHAVSWFQPSTTPRSRPDIQSSERLGLAREPELARWLKSLPRPFAVFACNDICAQQVLNTCREHHLRVPEDVAVLGVDNDDVLCNLCDPPLSSIEPNTAAIGYQAAALLDRLMRGKRTVAGITSVAPRRLVERNSTDTIAVEDSVLITALRFIREHVGRGIAAKDVIAQARRSRTDLEQRFQRGLGHSIRQEILRRRLEFVTRQLEQTELPVKDIAAAAGFATSAHLCRLFQQQFGRSPTRHRLEHQPGALAAETWP